MNKWYGLEAVVRAHDREHADHYAQCDVEGRSRYGGIKVIGIDRSATQLWHTKYATLPAH